MPTILAAGNLGDYFTTSWGWAPMWASALAAIVHGVLLLGVFANVALVFIWLERKVSARIQDRLGPTRVGGKFGWLQGLADGIKLIQKEDLVPDAADGMLFRMAPYLACIAAFGTLMVLPFSDGWVAVASDVGLFLLFAILSLEVLGIILAGYSSGSKWSLFGGMREAAQMVSYEIPLAICGLVPIVAVGTLNLTEVGRMQSGWVWNWLMFHDPFCFLAFFVYFTVATAGCKRAPFDLAEAESELVGGFHTEYSGMRWSYFFMAEYAAMFVVSGVASLLFLGGWHTGIGFFDIPLEAMRASGDASNEFVPLSYLANFFGMFVFASKASLLVIVQIWVRWTLPRLRIDQVMMTCLKYLVPISCILFLGAVLWPLILFSMIDRTHWSEPLGDKLYRPRAAASETTDTDRKDGKSSRIATVREGGAR
jgi:NADH-quinone oxidoreductase subunit H